MRLLRNMFSVGDFKKRLPAFLSLCGLALTLLLRVLSEILLTTLVKSGC